MKHRGISLSLVVLAAACAHAQIRLPAILGDHAMFQSGKPVAIWGWAGSGETVKVAFLNVDGVPTASFTAQAGSDGKWSGALAAMTSGTAGKLRISATGEPDKVVNDLLVGEVWLGSGQSNMEYDLAATGRLDRTIPGEADEVARNIAAAQKEAEAADPPIRYFRVSARHADQPMDDVKGNWILADANNVPRISAVAWNFAIALQNKLHVPVGMIVSCVGNTPIETWMSRETLTGTSVGAAVYERSRQDMASSPPEKVAAYISAMKAWQSAYPTPELQNQNRSTRPIAPPNPSAANDIPNQYYNGMIHGLQPYSIRGVIWYQGASNSGHPTEYGEMFTALIKEWRREWHDANLPFYFVEESPFGPKQKQPVEPNSFSIVREQQHQALALPATGMIASIDLGNGNPHYPNKRPVGQRLAGLALRDCYGKPGPVMSPMYQSFSIAGNKVRLKFRDADGLRSSGNGKLQGFAIRGEHGDWVWATAKIEGQDIVVSSDRVRKPEAVRYAWAVNPLISIENGAGLPLYPFRTDTGSKE